MSGYDIYIFCLCFITLVGFAGVLGYLLAALVKGHVKEVNAGIYDEELKKEYNQEKKAVKGCLNSIITTVFCFIFFALFIFSTVANISGGMFFENIPTLKMVNSGSMSIKNEKNTYLVTNDLNDQIQTFDLVFIYKAPPEEELEKYDIVLYEVDGNHIIHRIIEIEEPNKDHPTERYFLCRGDSNENSDRFPVLYSQIRGIYRGGRIPFVGSFITFLQSPAGWLCFILVVLVTFIMPVLERKLQKVHFQRLVAAGYIDKNGNLLPKAKPEEKEPEEKEPKEKPLYEILLPPYRINVYSKKDAEESVDKEKSFSLVSSSGEIIKIFNDLVTANSSEPEGEPSEIVEWAERAIEESEVQGPAFTRKKPIPISKKLANATGQIHDLYSEIDNSFRSYKKVTVRISNKAISYYRGRKILAKLMFNGSTLRMYFALDVSAFEYNKYFQKDMSGVKAYASVPFAVKVKSDRALKRACELIGKVCTLNELKHDPTYERVDSIKLLKKENNSQNDITEWAEKAIGEADKNEEQRPTFTKKKPAPISKKLLTASGQIKDWFSEIDNSFRCYKKITVRISNKAISYYSGRKILAKLMFNGRTVRMYFALDVNAFEYGKYFQKDMSGVKAYASVPFSVKVKSDRALKRAKELISAVCDQNELKLNPKYEKVDSIKLIKKGK